MNYDKKMWSSGSNVLYYAENSANILKAFNEIITGLYHISDEHEYIFHTLNTKTYVQAEYKRLLSSIGINLDDLANKLEIIRSLLFGDCFNWYYIHENLENHIKSKAESEDNNERD